MIEVTDREAASLHQAGRGYPAPAAAPQPHSPTFEEYVAAGYLPENYPPAGYEEVPSDGLTAYREQQAAAKAEDEKATATAAADKAKTKAAKADK